MLSQQQGVEGAGAGCPDMIDHHVKIGFMAFLEKEESDLPAAFYSIKNF